MKRRVRWLFDYLANFYFIYFLLHVEELRFSFQFFFLLIAILIFLISDAKQSQKMRYYLRKNRDAGGW